MGGGGGGGEGEGEVTAQRGPLPPISILEQTPLYCLMNDSTNSIYTHATTV